MNLFQLQSCEIKPFKMDFFFAFHCHEITLVFKKLIFSDFLSNADSDSPIAVSRKPRRSNQFEQSKQFEQFEQLKQFEQFKQLKQSE